MFGTAEQLLQIIENTMFGAISLAARLQSTGTWSAEFSFTQYRHTQTHKKQSMGLGVDIVLKKISQEKIAEIYKQWKIRNILCSKSSRRRYMTGVCQASCGGKRAPSSLPPATAYIIPKLPSSYYKLCYNVGVDIVLNKISQEKVCLNIQTI